MTPVKVMATSATVRSNTSNLFSVKRNYTAFEYLGVV